MAGPYRGAALDASRIGGPEGRAPGDGRKSGMAQPLAQATSPDGARLPARRLGAAGIRR